MEIIILTKKMFFLTHGDEIISRNVRHCNSKVAIHVVMGIVTTENCMLKKN
jgi:hypothetical protein